MLHSFLKSNSEIYRKSVDATASGTNNLSKENSKSIDSNRNNKNNKLIRESFAKYFSEDRSTIINDLHYIFFFFEFFLGILFQDLVHLVHCHLLLSLCSEMILKLKFIFSAIL